MLKISYRGSKKDIARARKVLSGISALAQMKESEARLKIQDSIDEHNLKAEVYVNGHTVWSKKRILKNLDRIIKRGTLSTGRYVVTTGSLLRFPVGQPTLSKYFYQFLHLECGSIAHYNIHGWTHEYPTTDHLKKFFMRNEFGQRVLDFIPEWHTDVKRIVEEIELKLFPFRAYMKAQAPSPFLG